LLCPVGLFVDSIVGMADVNTVSAVGDFVRLDVGAEVEAVVFSVPLTANPLDSSIFVGMADGNTVSAVGEFVRLDVGAEVKAVVFSVPLTASPLGFSISVSLLDIMLSHQIRS